MLKTALNNRLQSPPASARLIRVCPAPGRRVLDEFSSQPLPAAGAEVPYTPFIARCLSRGDLTETAPASGIKEA